MTLELMCLIIFGAFTAGLYSSLAVVKNQLPFKDLTDLYENSNFKVGTVKGSIYEYNFKVSRDLHFLRIISTDLGRLIFNSQISQNENCKIACRGLYF